jgi:hypothetical protein
MRYRKTKDEILIIGQFVREDFVANVQKNLVSILMPVRD